MKQILHKLILILIGFPILPVLLAFFFTFINWIISLIPFTSSFETIQCSGLWVIWGFCIVGFMIIYYILLDEYYY